ncbi:MAG: division/cell wall cluster transcriptional repressor MraZ [Firmicutes bacterium]|nr:division/cell wall cluster transcriptional repressor MraZ [Bacillota bacterium]
MIVPNDLRYSMGTRFIMTRGIGGCIYVFTSDKWHDIEDKLEKLPTFKEGALLLRRFLSGGAVEVTTDQQGRVLIPQNLREYAGIDKEVIITGLTNIIEIWDKKKWDEQVSKFDEQKLYDAFSDFEIL